MAETLKNTKYFNRPPHSAEEGPGSAFFRRSSIAHMDTVGDIDRCVTIPQGVTLKGWTFHFKDLDTHATPTLTLIGYIHSPSSTILAAGLSAGDNISLFTDSLLPQTGGTISTEDAAAVGIGATERANIGVVIEAPDAEVRLETTEAAATAVATAFYTGEVRYDRIFEVTTG